MTNLTNLAITPPNPSSTDDTEIQSEGANKSLSRKTAPIRGSLRLTTSAASPQVSAGTDFSVFVIIQNPFDVPITIYQVLTHIPVELMDVNGARLEKAKRDQMRKQQPDRHLLHRLLEMFVDRLQFRSEQTGVAIAMGTDFSPGEQFSFVTAGNIISDRDVTIKGLDLTFSQNPTTEELDRIFRRIAGFQKGVIPVQLQPGDSIIKQFVLRTRNWLFFVPLAHTFQIQVNYSMDEADHNETLPYQLTIRSTMAAVTVGAVIGALVGTVLRSLTGPSSSGLGTAPLLQALAISVLASLAVVVAFARKASAQPIVSIEDFWGGALIGFSVGFFGFEQFNSLFSTPVQGQ